MRKDLIYDQEECCKHSQRRFVRLLDVHDDSFLCPGSRAHPRDCPNHCVPQLRPAQSQKDCLLQKCTQACCYMGQSAASACRIQSKLQNSPRETPYN
ncbi:unnamed protein product [Moneuplotes crassus]|uniref:Uncharacterized protein n=1 Tax=Euplotes crassus TaxID=5936 RepID=A0AAD1X902_EUPCR|nr:unnamed protein product [Moneuplotes crassus]